MNTEEQEDRTIYRVVVNHEEQYSIWLDDKENAPGWKDAGKKGTKQECLQYIEEVWTDMRPLSLRKKMEELKNNPPAAKPPGSDDKPLESLPVRLSKGNHPVVAVAVPRNDFAAFKGCVDRGFVHIKFTATRGGTELGFKVDPDHSDLSGGDFEKKSGEVKLAGNLTLDSVEVRCVAKINLADLTGTGHLEILDPSAS